MDIVDKKTRSRMMAGIRSRDTQPEIRVRKYLHAHGFRFRLHTAKLPGRPDIVLARYRIAIFVHGCFWHRHENCKLTTMPAENQKQWNLKFESNKTRDQKNIEAILGKNWKVIVIWECGLREKDWSTKLAWLPNAIRLPSASLIQWPS